ncbi:MAG TPA: DUF4440 domain-containing protein [Lacunisphaera sp.]|jgi:ketosteroid isomerase-like protein
MKNDLRNFKRFMKVREEASRAFVNGDIAPLDAISTQVSPASIFDPKGDCVVGAKKVNAVNAAGARAFVPVGKSRFKVIQMELGKRVAFWAGIQRATVRIKGKPQPVPMDFRVTEGFRCENGEWKLVHRHADPLPAGSKKKKS